MRQHRRRDLLKCTNYYGVLDSVLGGLHQPHAHALRGSVVRPLFTGSVLAEFSDGKLNSLTGKLYRRLAHLANTQAKVDATFTIWAYTTDIMLQYVLGENSCFLDLEDLKHFHSQTRALSVINYATILRTIPIINSVLDLFPVMKRLSVHSWIETVRIPQLSLLILQGRQAFLVNVNIVDV